MKMVSVDPGTSTCGVAIWDINDKFEIVSLNSLTIKVNTDIYLDTRILTVYDLLLNIFKEEKPMVLVHESGFIDRFRPQAYGPIYATIFIIRNSFRKYMETVNDDYIFQYPPKMVKALMSTGEAGKLDMLKAVKDNKELSPFLTDVESEHAIDAIAIGYTHLTNLRFMPELLLIKG